MKKYRIIASDLDGTLLNSASDISRENIDAIKRLNEEGVIFVTCTGRGYSEIPEKLLSLPFYRYSICSNGAVVYDRESGRRILKCISSDVVRKLLDILKPFDVHITFRHNGTSYVYSDVQGESVFDYYHVIPAHEFVVRNFGVVLNDIEKVICDMNDIEAFCVFFKNYDDKLLAKELIEKTEKLNAVEISKYSLEIMNVDAGKGNALLSLAEALEISRDQTIGVGDSDNDISLVTSAGLGLAVSNAFESLKNVADEVICSNEEHIAEYILKNYILQK